MMFSLGMGQITSPLLYACFVTNVLNLFSDLTVSVSIAVVVAITLSLFMY
jgi:hypothetical protein